MRAVVLRLWLAGTVALWLATCSPAPTPPSAPDPEKPCAQGELRCDDHHQVLRCAEGDWVVDKPCPLPDSCRTPAPGQARCVPTQLDAPDLSPLIDARLTLGELAALPPGADSPSAALVERVYRHYEREQARRVPGKVAPAQQVGLDALQRVVFARLLVRRILETSFALVKNSRGFSGLADTPIAITESPTLSYHFFYTTDQEGSIPGVRLELLLSENPNAGVGVAERLVQVFGHDIGLYLSIGYIDQEPWGETNFAREIRDLGERFGANLVHVFRREAFLRFSELCAHPDYLPWLRDGLGFEGLPEDWTHCNEACLSGLGALAAHVPLWQREPALAAQAPPETPPAAALCVGILGLFGSPADLEPPAPDRRLPLEAVVGMWQSVFGDTGLTRLLLTVAGRPSPRYAELLLALRRVASPVLREQVEPLVRQGPSPRALALIPIWAERDERHAAAVLETLYPRYQADPQARRVLIDALGHNPATENLPFLSARIQDGTITRRPLYALLNIDTYRPQGLAAVLAHGSRFNAEQALAVLEFMMAMQPGTRGVRPTELLPLVEMWLAQTADFRVYQLSREVIGAYTLPNWQRPQRSPELDAYFSRLDATPQDAETRRELRQTLLDASPDEMAWLVHYLSRLQEDPQRRAVLLLGELARESPAWREGLTRMTRLHESPEVATLTEKALAGK